MYFCGIRARIAGSGIRCRGRRGGCHRQLVSVLRVGLASRGYGNLLGLPVPPLSGCSAVLPGSEGPIRLQHPQRWVSARGARAAREAPTAPSVRFCGGGQKMRITLNSEQWGQRVLSERDRARYPASYNARAKSAISPAVRARWCQASDVICVCQWSSNAICAGKAVDRARSMSLSTLYSNPSMSIFMAETDARPSFATMESYERNVKLPLECRQSPRMRFDVSTWSVASMHTWWKRTRPVRISGGHDPCTRFAQRETVQSNMWTLQLVRFTTSRSKLMSPRDPIDMIVHFGCLSSPHKSLAPSPRPKELRLHACREAGSMASKRRCPCGSMGVLQSVPFGRTLYMASSLCNRNGPFLSVQQTSADVLRQEADGGFALRLTNSTNAVRHGSERPNVLIACRRAAGSVAVPATMPCNREELQYGWLCFILVRAVWRRSNQGTVTQGDVSHDK